MPRSLKTGLWVTSLVLAMAIAPAAHAAELRVLAFNVLAPIWASPIWYPDLLDPALLETSFRRPVISDFVATRATQLDVACFQEVTESELPHLLSALGPDFDGMLSVNDPEFWSSYLDGRPWEPNGTALALRMDAFREVEFVDLALGDGNHATLATAVHAATGRPVRIASVHLDSDRTNNRRTEILAVLAALPPAPDAIDLICGDFNEDTVIGMAAGIARREGFEDVLDAVGNREATHPFDSSYNASPRWAIIDHVIVRGATPLAGDVVDFGLWSLADEIERIEGNLRSSGSDHFPLVAVVAF